MKQIYQYVKIKSNGKPKTVEKLCFKYHNLIKTGWIITLLFHDTPQVINNNYWQFKWNPFLNIEEITLWVHTDRQTDMMKPVPLWFITDGKKGTKTCLKFTNQWFKLMYKHHYNKRVHSIDNLKWPKLQTQDYGQVNQMAEQKDKLID